MDIKIQQAHFISFFKMSLLKNNKNNYNFLFDNRTKNMRLLISLVFSQYGSACEYGIIFQISKYNWIQNFIF